MGQFSIAVAFVLLLAAQTRYASCVRLGEQEQAKMIEQVIDQLADGSVDAESLDNLVQQFQELLENDTQTVEIIQKLIGQLAVGNVDLRLLVQQLAPLVNSSGTGQGLEGLGLTPGEIDLATVAEIAFTLQRYVQENVLRNVSGVCRNDTSQFFNDVFTFQSYATQMLLSNGNFLDLLKFWTTYNGVSQGNIEQCQAVKEWNPDAPFETKYCTAHISAITSSGVLSFSLGLCVPFSCSEADLGEMFGAFPVIGPIESLYVRFSCMVPYPWTAGAIVTLCILWIFLLLVVIGTTYHVIAHRRIQASIVKSKAKLEKVEDAESEGNITRSEQEKDIELENDIGSTSDTEKHDNLVDAEGAVEVTKETPTHTHMHRTCASRANKKKVKKMGFLDTVMMGFSALHNGAKILNTEQPAGSLAVLNGIRVISMWWIILGHIIQYIPPFLDDPRYALSALLPSFTFSAVVYSSVYVDTFFFLSGLLLAYLTLKHLKKVNGKLNWGLFYLHRFIRITPAYMICLAVWATLTVHFGEGPHKIDNFEVVAAGCRERWWTNLLYINNLLPFPGDLTKLCMDWSWYLSNDMQFFIISPAIIYLLYKKPKWGLGLIAALCLASFIITASLAAHYGVAVGLNDGYNNNTLVEFGNKDADIIYGKPYCRIPAYLIGMVFGYIFYRRNGKSFKMRKWVNAILWTICFGVGLAIIYGPYRTGGSILPQYAAVMYTVFSRPVYVMAVGWVAFACSVGYGGPVNALLSWGFWTPLSRITFGAYLLHPIIIISIYNAAKAQYHFSYMLLATLFVSVTVFAYVTSFVLSICVEGPIMGLEKALLGGGARGKKK